MDEEHWSLSTQNFILTYCIISDVCLGPFFFFIILFLLFLLFLRENVSAVCMYVWFATLHLAEQIYNPIAAPVRHVDHDRH